MSLQQSIRHGLAARALLLISLFVLAAEVAFYAPALANFHDSWLRDRVSAAYTAALVFQVAPEEVPEAAARVILESAGVKTIVLKYTDTKRLLAATDMPPRIDAVYDLRNQHLWASIMSALRILLEPSGRILQLVSDGPMGGQAMEVTLDETPLQRALSQFAVRLLVVSLSISVMVAVLATAAVHALILRPVRRLTSHIVAFGANPDDATRQIKPSEAQHEIGLAERALLRMQSALLNELAQRQRLAALGLAVAHISHDLRNMLAPAQLLSDRLGELSDPLAKRIAPKLVATLDRAIAFCQSTLTYGGAAEKPPMVQRIALSGVVGEAVMTVAATAPDTILIENAIAHSVFVLGDPDHLYRVFLNLLRNAVDALSAQASSGSKPAQVAISAHVMGAFVEVHVLDNGPGVPKPLQPSLFKAFQGSGRPGGFGLGLAIAADLVRAQGGTIALNTSQITGADFVVRLPTAPPA